MPYETGTEWIQKGDTFQSVTFLNVQTIPRYTSGTYYRYRDWDTTGEPRGLWARGVIGDTDLRTYGTITNTDTDGGISLLLGFASTASNSSTASLNGTTSKSTNTDFTELLKVSDPRQVLHPKEVKPMSDMLSLWTDTAYREGWKESYAKPAIKEWGTESYNFTGRSSKTLDTTEASDGTGWVSVTDTDHSNTTYFVGTTTYGGTGTRPIDLKKNLTSTYTQTRGLSATASFVRISKKSTTFPTVVSMTMSYENKTITSPDVNLTGTLSVYDQHATTESTYTTSTYINYITNTYTTSEYGSVTGTTTDTFTAITGVVANTSFFERSYANEVEAYGYNLGNLSNTGSYTGTSSATYWHGKSSMTKTITNSVYFSEVTLNLNATRASTELFKLSQQVGTSVSTRLTQSRYTQVTKGD